MRTQQIQMFKRESIPVFKTKLNAVAINPKKKFLWLQKICFKIMQKLGCEYVQECVEYHIENVQAEEFIEKIFAQTEAHYSWHYTKPDLLLIGSEDYRKMMHSKVIDEQFYFNASYNVHSKDGYDKVFGMRVVVLPQMSGMISLCSKDIL